MIHDLILDIDAYKASHFLQYPPDTQGLFSYFESRGSDLSNRTVFFGLQYILSQIKPITLADVVYARDFFSSVGVTFPYDGWKYIAEAYGGYPPVEIRAVREGSIVPTHNVLWTIENTDRKVPWITNWMETMLVRNWYPITVATISYLVRRDLEGFLERSSDNPEQNIAYGLNDFGSRGVSSSESAVIGGMAHLLVFRGSDTCIAMQGARESYQREISPASINAAEHSTVIAWGEEHEIDAYRHILRQFAKNGIVAVVSDSYDLYNAVQHIWGETLHDEVIDSGATVVIRPDSGDPLVVVPDVLNMLADKFGTYTNSKGYRVLKNVKVIQGDGVNPKSIHAIMEKVLENGFSAENVVFGMGGALLQDVTRDTFNFGCKLSAVLRDGKWLPVSKHPTGSAMKKSKAGRLDLDYVDGEYKTVVVPAYSQKSPNSAMGVVYRNGTIVRNATFAEVERYLNEQAKND